MPWADQLDDCIGGTRLSGPLTAGSGLSWDPLLHRNQRQTWKQLASFSVMSRDVA